MSTNNFSEEKELEISKKVPVDNNQDSSKIQLNFKWKDLSYVVQDKYSKEAQEKIVLDNVRGAVCSGQVIGILGPSGSGKTSLLNCLSQRNTQGVSGEILINEKELPAHFSRNIGYVSQDELFMQALTVHETLSYAAQLKLKKSSSKIREAVQNACGELDLWKVRKSLIGELGNGISGGERRRLAIALEIIDEPFVLLLDEPTSGLDAASALMVAKLLKKMAKNRGVAVICTIHQPRVKVLKMFDKVSLMGLGKVLYYGATVPTCVEYFSNAGYKCPKFENPADWMLDLVNTSEISGKPEKVTGDRDEDSEITEKLRPMVIEDLARQFKNSKDFSACLGPVMTGDLSLTAQIGYRTSIFNQFWVLLKRNFMYKLREPTAFGTQLFNDTAMPLVIGLLYWDLGLSQTSIGDRMNFISIVILMQSFAAFDEILLYAIERPLYVRENTSGLYRTSAYIMAKLFSEHPTHALCAFIGSPIYYYMAGLQNDTGKFFTFTVIMIMGTVTGASMLSACGAVAKTLEQSNLLATILIVLFMILDGTWVSLERIPDSLEWVSKLSFMGLAVQAAIYNEFDGIDNFECNEDLDICFHTGTEVLEFYGFQNVKIWNNMYTLLLQFWFWKIVSYLSVRFLYTGVPFKKRLKM